MQPDKILEELDSVIASALGDNVPHGLARTLRATQKEIVFAKNFHQGQAEWPEKRSTVDPTKIQIGGGTHTLEGFINIDIIPPADLLWDIREGIPLDDGVSEFIFSEHFFEHIDYPTSVKKVVSELYRVLKSGGQVVTGVPDGGFVLEGYAKKDPELRQEMMERWYNNRSNQGDFNTYIDLVNYVFRDQDDDDKYNPHYWAYDLEKLVSLFKDAGFSSVEPWTFDPALANPKREWGSVYVIATK